MKPPEVASNSKGFRSVLSAAIITRKSSNRESGEIYA